MNYIKKLYFKNVGPIKDFFLEMPFNEDNGNPKPVILVGENGSGKSLILSNIVDSFYQIANRSYQNAMIKHDNGGEHYYKIIQSAQISIGQKYLGVYIEYSDNKEYIFKIGKISFDEFKKQTSLEISNVEWMDEKANFKNDSFNEKDSEELFSKNVICFFPPDRYSKPGWMGNKYMTYKYENLSNYEHVKINEKYKGHLENNIMFTDDIPSTLQWLIDVIIDSRPDIEFYPPEIRIKDNPDNFNNPRINHYSTLVKMKENIDSILKMILGQNVYLSLNLRNHRGTRLNIKKTISTSSNKIIPTLDSLSTGQMALFQMFLTILRYADNEDIENILSPENITGIVVIDEIELHLHSNLQRDVLPKLIKKFPKIQFIITSHSPLFLLGMEEVYGEENYEIYELPNGNKIDVEKFSEFQKAYEYLSKTEKHQEEVSKKISEAIKKEHGKTLIITEGSTDWKHMKAAWENLKEKGDCEIELNDSEFEFLEYVESMGGSELHNMCKHFSKVSNEKKIIFIADRDNEDIVNKLNPKDESEKPYKEWENNVFSLILPVPKHRKETPEISIEHYYTDEEIKTEVIEKDIVRRLFMGNEFDEEGMGEGIRAREENKCGDDRINIIDRRVKKTEKNSKENLALTKMEFADNVLQGKEPFNNFDFSNFMELFKIVEKIIKSDEKSTKNHLK